MNAREWQRAFPSEFNKMQRLEAGTAISNELIRRYNCAVDIAYHTPNYGEDEEGNIKHNKNYHAHILYTTRGFDEEQESGWSKNKYRNLSKDYVLDENGKIALNDEGKKIIKSSQEALEMRALFADEMNIIAKRDKLDVKTEHLSFKQRGIDKEPSQHLGSTANEMEKKGKKSERGDINRDIKAANDNRAELAELKKQKKIILLDHEREKRKLEQEHQKTGLEKVTDIYKNSLNGEAFKQAIELDNIYLAKGKTGGFVLVDDKGNIHSLVKNIDGASYKEIAVKLSDIEKDNLHHADELAAEIQANPEQKIISFDRESGEVKAQHNLSDASEKYAREQIKIDERAGQLVGKIRLELWDKHDNKLKDLKKNQGYELSDYIQNLRDEDTAKEAQHRAYYAPEITKDRQEKLRLQQLLRGSGVKGALFCFRHGKRAFSEIKALEKNIANGEMRLKEGVNGLDRFDYQKIQNRKARHADTVQELKNRHDLDIQKTEGQARTLAENQLNEEAYNRVEKAKIQLQAKIAKADALAKAQEAKQAQQKQIEAQRAEQAIKQVQAVREAQKQEVKPSISNDDFGSEFLSKEDIEKNVKAHKAQYQENELSSSFMDELTPEQREKVQQAKEEIRQEPEQGEKQEQGQGHRPELD